MGYLRPGYHGLEGHLGTIWGPVWEVRSEGHLRSNLRSILVNLGPILRKPHQYTKYKVLRAVGRALRLEYAQYGSRDGSWLGTGIALPDPPSYPTPV